MSTRKFNINPVKRPPSTPLSGEPEMEDYANSEYSYDQNGPSRYEPTDFERELGLVVDESEEGEERNGGGKRYETYTRKPSSPLRIPCGCCSVTIEEPCGFQECCVSCNAWCLSLADSEDGASSEPDDSRNQHRGTYRQSLYQKAICSTLARWFFMFLEAMQLLFRWCTEGGKSLSRDLKRESVCYNRFCDGLDLGCPVVWRCFCGTCTLSTFWSVLSSTYRNWAPFKWASLTAFLCFVLLASPLTTVRGMDEAGTTIAEQQLHTIQELNVVNGRIMLLWTIGIIALMIMIGMFVQQYMSLYSADSKELNESDIMRGDDFSRSSSSGLDAEIEYPQSGSKEEETTTIDLSRESTKNDNDNANANTYPATKNEFSNRITK